MLLGEDFLRDNGILIDFSNDSLLVKGKTIDLKYKPNLEVCRVSFSSHTNICAKSVMNVSCKVAGGLMKEGTNGIVKPAEQFDTKYGLGVICVADTIRNGEIPVRIINPSDNDVVIWKGSSVGQLYPLLPEANMNDTSIPSHCYFVQVDSQTFARTVNRSTDSQVSDRKDIPELFSIDNPEIPESEKNLIYGILKQHEKVISQGPNDLGSVSSIKHKINTGDAEPRKAPMRRMSPVKRDIIRQELNDMLKAEVIEQSESPWSSGVVLVNKKDGGRRFCVDYRALNEVTKKDSYPLPRADDVLESLSGARYFSHFDLVRGYWQFEVEEADREKTAFITPDGHYQFRKRSFGLTGAPATFQRAMDVILRGLSWVDLVVYLNDIVVFANTLEEHRRRLEALLDRLENAGLKIKPEKCKILP